MGLTPPVVGQSPDRRPRLGAFIECDSSSGILCDCVCSRNDSIVLFRVGGPTGGDFLGAISGIQTSALFLFYISGSPLISDLGVFHDNDPLLVVVYVVCPVGLEDSQ